MFECLGPDVAGRARLVSLQMIILKIDRFPDSHGVWRDCVFCGCLWLWHGAWRGRTAGTEAWTRPEDAYTRVEDVCYRIHIWSSRGPYTGDSW